MIYFHIHSCIISTIFLKGSLIVVLFCVEREQLEIIIKSIVLPLMKKDIMGGGA
jgi:hypothetical protein